jgi:hypothetical protein
VSYFDEETNKRLRFLTNNFALPALTIAQIYKQRWQVELFLCVQPRLAYSAGVNPAGVKVKPRSLDGSVPGRLGR